MQHLPPHDVRSISLKAARDAVGVDPDDVEVRQDADSAGRLAYLISFRFRDDAERTRASLRHIGLSHAIRDELIRHGDEHYPFIRFLAAKDWARRVGAEFF